MKTDRYIRVFFSAVIASAVAGCAVGKVVKEVEQDIQQVRQGPKELPVRNITDFADGLRCMDNLFSVFGYTKDEYTILMEDIKDKTKKVDAGAKDMLISAVSDMTRRSQIIQLIAYGADSGNLVSFLSQADEKNVYDKIPPYDIIGSVSQLDKDIVRKQADLSGQVGGSIDGSTVGGGFGKSASNSASVLGLDLSVITTHNIAVIPGVTARNSAIIYKQGSASDFDAGISKTGVNFSISSNQSDGTSQALRALIELSAIELMGKLMKIPYWKCLGLDENHQEIQREISDWFYQLNQSGLIHQVIKIQLYLRGYYNGPIDEVVDDAYNNAVIAYKGRLGLGQSQGVDLDFYGRFLNDTPDSVDLGKLAYIRQQRELKASDKVAKVVESEGPRRKAKTVVYESVPQAPAEAPIQLSIGTNRTQDIYYQGENVNLNVSSNTNGFVTCYLESGDVIARIFPNRFSPDGFVSQNGILKIPDSAAYSVTADRDGEKVHCVITTQNIQTDLPHQLRLADFEVLPVSSVSEINAAYAKATQGRFAQQTYVIQVQ